MDSDRSNVSMGHLRRVEVSGKRAKVASSRVDVDAGSDGQGVGVGDGADCHVSDDTSRLGCDDNSRSNSLESREGHRPEERSVSSTRGGNTDGSTNLLEVREGEASSQLTVVVDVDGEVALGRG